MKYSDSDKKFLDYVRSELGDYPKNQTKVFYYIKIVGIFVELGVHQLKLVGKS